eukprot:CAMPEP_0204087408 /NCGR_PEP_ID=MMETSP0360-20130528/184634_1 /ASSEMBLY_ACC=CAM_ASM_000342 /TAXON_ID=268821 /ORGANISM="Scrippsiella Hangoei, Strain SHTV-5" /LENGTH=76 /DNA_ID=CAMNT_0051036559 /DNA_START=130 /DNA_END=356 /DNA_ORIENTATION=-
MSELGGAGRFSLAFPEIKWFNDVSNKAMVLSMLALLSDAADVLRDQEELLGHLLTQHALPPSHVDRSGPLQGRNSL